MNISTNFHEPLSVQIARHDKWKGYTDDHPRPYKPPTKSFPGSPFRSDYVPVTEPNSKTPITFTVKMTMSYTLERWAALKVLKHLATRQTPHTGVYLNENEGTAEIEAFTWNKECFERSLEMWKANGSISNYELRYGGQQRIF